MSLIHLVGPGGAGKSTVGAVLSHRLNCCFVDLDRYFNQHTSDISDYLTRHSYHRYSRRNVEMYLAAAVTDGVIALSSGFMTYGNVHPRYLEICRTIANGSTTFVLLPSLDLEECAIEIVRRQLSRGLSLNASTEELKIRERFPIYAALPARKIITMQPPQLVADQIIHLLQT